MTASLPASISTRQRLALERLIAIAQTGSGQAGSVANFLLAWWNADDCGGFNLIDLWSVDAEISADMCIVFAMVRQFHSYPDALGYDAELKTIYKLWRPAKSE